MQTMFSYQSFKTKSSPSNVTNHFHPRIWESNEFLTSSMHGLNETRIREERLHELKKESGRYLLSLASKNLFKALDFVDKIQQLGIGYHFEKEFEDIFQRAYNNQNFIEDDRANLYYISIHFRLLRQAGFYISTDIFNKYRNPNEEFHASLVTDVQGMLSFYEATYLAIPGEDLLDDIQDFTSKHLSSMVNHLSSPLSLQIQLALNTPLHYGAERVHARHYISIYEEDDLRNETLLEFAKLDFNDVQLLHKKELNALSEWWEKVTNRVKHKLPFQFRDRLVEAYIICMGIIAEPRFSTGRIHLTKMWCIFTIFDDVHDIYGNIEELQALHDALQRWDTDDLDELAEHMKIIFHEMKNLFKEIEVDFLKKGHFVGLPCLKKQFQVYIKSQFDEAKIMYSKNMPKFETWLSLSVITAGLNPFIVNAIMNLGEPTTEEVFDWIDSKPEILTTCGLIARLLDDIAGYKHEKDKGILIISNVTCYMKEYGVSEQEAMQSLQGMVKLQWKNLNRDFLRAPPAVRPVFKIIIGILHTMTEFYSDKYGDGYTNSNGRTKDLIVSLLKDPIST